MKPVCLLSGILFSVVASTSQNELEIPLDLMMEIVDYAPNEVLFNLAKSSNIAEWMVNHNLRDRVAKVIDENVDPGPNAKYEFAFAQDLDEMRKITEQWWNQDDIYGLILSPNQVWKVVPSQVDYQECSEWITLIPQMFPFMTNGDRFKIGNTKCKWISNDLYMTVHRWGKVQVRDVRRNIHDGHLMGPIGMRLLLLAFALVALTQDETTFCRFQMVCWVLLGLNLFPGVLFFYPW